MRLAQWFEVKRRRRKDAHRGTNATRTREPARCARLRWPARALAFFALHQGERAKRGRVLDAQERARRHPRLSQSREHLGARARMNVRALGCTSPPTACALSPASELPMDAAVATSSFHAGRPVSGSTPACVGPARGVPRHHRDGREQPDPQQQAAGDGRADGDNLVQEAPAAESRLSGASQATEQTRTQMGTHPAAGQPACKTCPAGDERKQEKQRREPRETEQRPHSRRSCCLQHRSPPKRHCRSAGQSGDRTSVQTGRGDLSGKETRTKASGDALGGSVTPAEP